MEHLEEILGFIQQVDALKDVQRRIRRQDGTKLEDDAQHSWHVAMMAVVLAPYNEEPVNLSRALQMAIVHDLPEIETGDIWTFDDQARIGKSQSEEAAMRRLVSTLPEEQAQHLIGLWLEYEQKETAEARFIQKLDKVQPMIQNLLSGGIDWKAGPITETILRQKKDHHYLPGTNLYAFYNRVIEIGRERNILEES